MNIIKIIIIIIMRMKTIMKKIIKYLTIWNMETKNYMKKIKFKIINI